MKIIRVYDKTKTYVLPTNKLATPTYMAESNPATQVTTFLIATDKDGESLSGLYRLNQMKATYNFPKGLTDAEYCILLENEFNAPRTEEGKPPIETNPLAIAKTARIEEANKVNADSDEFLVNGKPLWLTLEERLALAVEQIPLAKNSSETEVTLSKIGFEITLPIALAEQMLGAIAAYAKVTKNLHNRNLDSIEKCTTVEAVNALDLSTGYPDKLTFNI